MNKVILKFSVILLIWLFVINLIVNISYAKYYTTENIEAINIKIEMQNELYKGEEI